MAEQSKTLLRVEGITKNFPGVQALDNVSLNIEQGEIHGLLGENGAGKSTLVKIITGALKQDQGKVILFRDNEELSVSNPMEARESGIAAAYQHLVIAPELSIAENFFLGRLPTSRLRLVDWPNLYKKSRKILEEYNLDLDPRKKIKDLSVARQVMITIIKVLLDNVALVIFDEPTALLTNEQREMLFSLIRNLKDNGISVLYISHYIEEALDLCDRITVLKDGKLVNTVSAREVDENMLISMMVGRKLGDMYNIEHNQQEEEVLRVQNLTREPDFHNISFSLKKGEILGFFGLIGAGRTEIMRCLFGVDHSDSGKIYIRGEEVKIRSPEHAFQNGIGLLPENRQLQGLALPLPVHHNINLTSLDDISTYGFINTKKEIERAKYYITNLDIRTPSYKEKVMKLSGGNQQKVVIAKLLCRNLDILIFDEATSGVDVGTKVEIYRLIEELIRQGKSIIYISSYLPELIGLTDRIIVVADGRIIGSVDAKDASEERLLQMASKSM